MKYPKAKLDHLCLFLNNNLLCNKPGKRKSGLKKIFANGIIVSKKDKNLLTLDQFKKKI